MLYLRIYAVHFSNPCPWYRRVYLYSLQDSARERGSFALHRQQDPHGIGAMAWGSGSTSDHLFASSEPEDGDGFDGLHKAYDLQSKTPLYSLDATEAGDTLCVGPTGK